MIDSVLLTDSSYPGAEVEHGHAPEKKTCSVAPGKPHGLLGWKNMGWTPNSLPNCDSCYSVLSSLWVWVPLLQSEMVALGSQGHSLT